MKKLNKEITVAAIMSKDIKKMVVAKLEEITGQKAKWNPAPKMYHTVDDIIVTRDGIYFHWTAAEKYYEEILKYLDEIELPYLINVTEDGIKANEEEIVLSEDDKMITIDKETKFDIEEEIHEFTEPIGEVKEEPKKKGPSTAKIVQEMLLQTLEGKNKEEAFKILTDKEQCHEILKIRYAFLLEKTENDNDRKINGFARYGKKTIEYEGKEYWMCNDLYKRNIEAVEKWIETMK